MNINKKMGKHSHEAKENELTQALNPLTETQDLQDAPTQAIDEPWSTIETVAMPALSQSGPDDELGTEDDSLAGYDIDSAGYPIEPPLVDPDATTATGFELAPEKKHFSGAKAFAITFGVLFCILAAAYVGVAMMFSNQFLPNTRIAGIDISMKQDDEVIALLDTIPGNYKLDLAGQDFALRLTGEDIQMQIDSQSIVNKMHEDLNKWHWPWYILETNHDETFLLETTYNQDSCNKLVEDAVKTFNKKAKAPTDASIGFDDDSQTFIVKPEKVGTQLDVQAVQAIARDAASDMQETATITADQLKQPALLSTDEKLNKTVEMANGMVSAHLNLKINGNTVDEITSETLSGFINISDKFEVTLNEDDLANWIAELASGYDTIGMARTYTRADGKTITVSGGTYGWEVDEAALRETLMNAIKEGKSTDIEIPCVDSANTYAGRGERDWGNRYIDVDLSEQHVRFYGDDGHIIWESDCISGAPDGEHDTTQGVWYVVMKQSPAKLVGYEGNKKEYETEVEYWMPFIGNSIGFHDATWQPDFGGSMYADGYGSHGCVNLPYSKAQSLYDIIQPNDVVVVHS